jgi:L-lactate dehydrogenase complex protein LldF
MSLAMGFLHLCGKKSGRLRHFPFLKPWTAFRDFPAPAGKTFQTLWQQRQKDQSYE